MSNIEACLYKLGGKPVVAGTRFPVSQLLIELTERSLEEIAEDFDLDKGLLQSVLCDLAFNMQLYRLEYDSEKFLAAMGG